MGKVILYLTLLGSWITMAYIFYGRSLEKSYLQLLQKQLNRLSRQMFDDTNRVKDRLDVLEKPRTRKKPLS